MDWVAIDMPSVKVRRNRTLKVRSARISACFALARLLQETVLESSDYKSEGTSAMISFLLFTLIATIVAATGVVLALSADKLGEAFGLHRSVTGFMLLAAATSLPELIVGCRIAQSGAVDMAVGGVLGSCLINLLVLGVIDLSQRSRGRMLNRKAAAHALAALASILLASVVAIAVLVKDAPTFGRYHAASAILLVVYLMTARLVYVDQNRAEEPENEPTTKKEEEKRLRPVWYYLGATALLLALAAPLANSSQDLAVLLGLSGTFFGAVFLALVTSLPEFVTTYQATRMDAQDLAIGNILGSNTFNLVILVGIDGFSPRPLFAELSSVHAVAAIGVIVTTTIAAMGLLYRAEERIWYLEPDAISVIASAMFFYYLIYVM